MNKFIELIGFVTKNISVDLGITPEEKEIRLSLKPSEIIGVRESMRSDDMTAVDECIIYLKNGESFVVKKSYDAMVKWLNTWAL